MRDYDRSEAISIPVDVFIYGPGLEQELNLQRKIVKSRGSKNWRLNGEFVYNPDTSPMRFNSLEPNDFAVFDFSESVFPVSVKVVFVAGAVPADKTLHLSLKEFLGESKMDTISPVELEEVVNRAKPPRDHPIHRLTIDTDTLDPVLEDIALGGSKGKGNLLSRPSVRKISREDLLKAKANADRVGRLGEEFVNDYLIGLRREGRIRGLEWVSDDDSISPYDFWVDDGIATTLIDVKSTQGSFERELHVSLNELQTMALGSENYDIYRVSEVKGSIAQLRISKNVRDFAKIVLEVLSNLPSGISSDSISFAPTILPFGSSITIELSEQEEEEE